MHPDTHLSILQLKDELELVPIFRLRDQLRGHPAFSWVRLPRSGPHIIVVRHLEGGEDAIWLHSGRKPRGVDRGCCGRRHKIREAAMSVSSGVYYAIDMHIGCSCRERYNIPAKVRSLQVVLDKFGNQCYSVLELDRSRSLASLASLPAVFVTGPFSGLAMGRPQRRGAGPSTWRISSPLPLRLRVWRVQRQDKALPSPSPYFELARSLLLAVSSCCVGPTNTANTI